MVAWRTSRLLILVMLLMAAVIGIAANEHYNLIGRAANLALVPQRLWGGTDTRPIAVQSVEAAGPALGVRSVYPVVRVPKQAPSVFATAP